MNQDPLFELTRSPQLNALITRTKEYYAGEITDAEFKESIKALNSFRRELRSFLREQIKFAVMTPSKRAQTDAIEVCLEDVRKSLEEMYSYFNDGDRGHVESGLEKCKSAFERLNAAVESIQREESSEKEYSKAPLQNELMRIGYAMIDGKVSPDAFRIKLDSLKNSLRMYYGYFGGITPKNSEKEYFEAHREEIRLTVREYIKALEEVGLYFRDSNVDHVKSGLSRSHAAAERLLKFQQEISEARTIKHCFKCGAENPAAAKFCVKCSAALPVMIDDDEETIDLQVDENDNVSRSGHVQTELTKKVSDVVSSFRSGSMSAGDAVGVISSIVESIAQTKKEKEKLKVPQEIESDAEYSPVFFEIEELMNRGLADMEQGLKSLSSAIENNDESGMMFALDGFLSGADSLSKVVMMSQQAQEEG